MISLGMYDSNGSSYKSENSILWVLKGSILVLKGTLNQGLYILQGEAISGAVAISSSNQEETILWHKRLGYMSMRGL